VLERPLSNLSVIVACATASKMVAILDKLLVGSQFNNTLVKAIEAAPGGKDCLTSAANEVIESKLTQSLKHCRERTVRFDDSVTTYFVNQDKSACNFIYYWMALAQFKAEEFDKFVSLFKDGENPDRPFSALVSRDDQHREFRNHLVASFRGAMARAVSSDCDADLESTVMNEALEASVLQVMINFHVELHGAVLDTIAIFCNALRIPQCIPALATAYRKTVWDLFNNKDTPCDNHNLKRLFDVFTCIVRLLERQDGENYITSATKNVTDVLALTYPGTSITLAEMMQDEDMAHNKKK